ncbi:MAG: hypothetical protein IPP87_12865 [Ideonella sp.]|nr:hypothetical protein [Ideonella sp.]
MITLRADRRTQFKSFEDVTGRPTQLAPCRVHRLARRGGLSADVGMASADQEPSP